MVATSPWFFHRLEHVWTDPLKFDPDRFAPGREEDKRVQFGFIGFGGGRHSCMGYNFAYLQVRVGRGCTGGQARAHAMDWRARG